MTKNVGGLDRILRIVLGAILITATAMGALPAWGLIGLIPLATGLISWCPVYPLLGINTCPARDESDKTGA